MKTTLIATLGFDEKFCYRAILRHGIKEGDELILITAEMEDRVEKAYEWIKKLIQTSYSDKVKVQLFEVGVGNPENAIKEVLKIINKVEGKAIINLSGGMRALVLIVLLACLIKPLNAKIEIELEDFSGIVELKENLLKLIKSPPSGIVIEILRHVDKGIKTVHDLASKMGKDESTIRRHIMSLEEDGLIIVEKRKPLVVKLSDLGRIFL